MLCAVVVFRCWLFVVYCLFVVLCCVRLLLFVDVVCGLLLLVNAVGAVVVGMWCCLFVGVAVGAGIKYCLLLPLCVTVVCLLLLVVVCVIAVVACCCCRWWLLCVLSLFAVCCLWCSLLLCADVCCAVLLFVV